MHIKRYLFIFCVLTGTLIAQPKIMVSLGGGYYEPQFPDFENNQLPQASFISRDGLLGFGIAYQFFPNARIGYSNFLSIQLGETENGAPFWRTLSYRMITLETYFISRRRMEWNFTLAPMWNKGKISLDTKSDNADWSAILSSYGNENIYLESADKMKTNWFGFASFIGFKYYFYSWLALDLKAGFMNNYYNKNKWKFQGKTINGPEIIIDKLPIFSAQLIYGW